MRLKLRSPNGTHVVTLSDTATVADLINEIRTTASLPTGTLEVKAGYPPRALDLSSQPPATLLTALPYKLQGEQLLVSTTSGTSSLRGSGAGVPSSSSSPSSSSNTKTSAASKPQTYIPPKAPKPTTTAPTSSSSSNFNFTDPSPGPLSLTRNAPRPSPDDPPVIAIPNRGTLILRIMPDDNSCLFRALSHVLTHSLMSATELRQLIAQTILGDTVTYSSAVLDQEPEAYCEWIKMETSWGGGIELSILANYFEVEIAAIDVGTCNLLRFNEGAPKRAIVVYSGIHYDAVAVVPPGGLIHEGGEDEVVFDKEDIVVLDAAMELGRELNKKKYFTDTANFDLRCNICKTGLKGEKGAVEHAKSTGHMDFGEF